MHKFYDAIARFIRRRSWWLVVLSLLLVGAAVPGITMLHSETGFDALVSPDSDLWKNNLQYQEEFGGEPFTLLLTGEIEDILSPANLEILSDFEQQINNDARYRSILGPLAVSAEYQAIFQQFAEYFSAEAQTIGDEELEQELEILDLLSGWEED